MPLDSISLNVFIQWTQSATNAGGFDNTTQGPDSVPFTLNGIDITTFDQIYTGNFTLAASATHTVDVTTLTNLVGESFGYANVLAIAVLPVGSNCVLSPGASNPLVWFFGGSTQSINVVSGGIQLYSGAAAGPGTTVSGTAKTLELNNTGGTSCTVQIILIGAT